ncbi:hypothetical protein [Rhodococcus jostii]|uniref:C4-dicarboxylate ABC transporter n=1 Tax=Rhodococcus jostii TaxID=132919 RepID=A0ABU4CC94_RHOJO|nr:hypothetical protein [Rhodococcus jostii]MDV6281164.1 hypothetical protein [Rhodococcus jostii]
MCWFFRLIGTASRRSRTSRSCSPSPCEGRARSWRHVANKVPLRYDATVWSIVFPLGMYAVAGIYLGRADHLPLVGIVGSAELWCAFTVWCVAFVVMVVHLWRSVVHVGPATVTTQENA